VAIKDDVDIAGQVTAKGGVAHGGPKEADAEVVTALRAAGAVILGKTHVPELTITSFTETLAYGATRNPWSFDHTPGGSSGGTGAAVAAGMCGVGLGSDGAGSIRIPAAWCGVFGLKPQRGRVSMRPNDDAWHGMSVNGPIARTVADAALFLDAAADPSAGLAVPAGGFLAPPAATRAACGSRCPPSCRRAPWRGCPPMRGGPSTTPRRSCGRSATTSSSASSTIRRPPSPTCSCATCGGSPRTRSRSRIPSASSGARAASSGSAGRSPPRRSRASAGGGRDRRPDQRDLRRRGRRPHPGPAGPPFRIGELQGRSAAWTLQRMAMRVPYFGAFNATGQPAASVPAGFDAAGLPLAVQLVGPPAGEAVLLALSAQLEAARPWATPRPPIA
jgi:amidase